MRLFSFFLSGRPEHYLRGQKSCLPGSAKGVLPPGLAFLEEGMIRFARFDHAVNNARHFCCDGGVGLSVQVRVMAVLRDVAFELVAKLLAGLGTAAWLAS
jgi:hypothetical protein